LKIDSDTRDDHLWGTLWDRLGGRLRSALEFALEVGHRQLRPDVSDEERRRFDRLRMALLCKHHQTLRTPHIRVHLHPNARSLEGTHLREWLTQIPIPKLSLPTKHLFEGPTCPAAGNC
jgi:hypothetical protein